MKKRIKEVKFDGKSKFYPQYRLCWIWWNYIDGFENYSDVISFDTLSQAKRFLEPTSKTIKVHDIP